MVKQTNQNSAFSKDREFTVILEDLRSQFKVFGEGLSDIGKRTERLEEKVDRIEMDISVIKIDLSVIKLVIPTLTTKKDLERFATKQDLQLLEKRIIVFEQH